MSNFYDSDFALGEEAADPFLVQKGPEKAKLPQTLAPRPASEFKIFLLNLADTLSSLFRGASSQGSDKLTSSPVQPKQLPSEEPVSYCQETGLPKPK